MGNETKNRSGERGSVMVIAALAMTALLLFAALAIDVGAVWASRTQSQNANDAAALAAAATMIKQSGTDPTTVDLFGARDEARLYAGANPTVGEAVTTKGKDKTRSGGVNVTPADIDFGAWDLQTRKLHTPGPVNFPDSTVVIDPSVDLTKPDQVNAVRVTVRMDGETNKKSPAFLSRLLGIDGFEVKNTAIAYRGFQGKFKRAEFMIPVAVDSCPLSTNGCGFNYCETISTTKFPCNLRWMQGANPVSCLDFSPTQTQNACWTAFDEDPAVTPETLARLIDTGNANDMHSGDYAYLDNGAKTVTLKYLRNKFYGCDSSGSNCGQAGSPTPAGADRYGPNPPGSPSTAPAIDSWVVKLPVYQCQQGAHCAAGVPWMINGGVCFEIREILAPSGDYNDSESLIKGRFLCPESPDPQERALFDEFCRDEGQDPGGCAYGLRADGLVLVH